MLRAKLSNTNELRKFRVGVSTKEPRSFLPLRFSLEEARFKLSHISLMLRNTFIYLLHLLSERALHFGDQRQVAKRPFFWLLEF
jgi:hypothetical protein